jgi:hypothetical protein
VRSQDLDPHDRAGEVAIPRSTWLLRLAIEHTAADEIVPSSFILAGVLEEAVIEVIDWGSTTT